jgi:hypothetical protein
VRVFCPDSISEPSKVYAKNLADAAQHKSTHKSTIVPHERFHEPRTALLEAAKRALELKVD